MNDRTALNVIDAQIATHHQQIAGLERLRSIIATGDTAPDAPERGPAADDQWPPDLATVDTSGPEWVAPKEAASIASCTIDEIYRRCRSGEIGIRRKGRWFVRRDRLFRYADLR